MPLGRFGGKSKQIRISAGGAGGGNGSGASASTGLLADSKESKSPSPHGTAADPSQLGLLTAGYGQNLLVNGSFESWSSGTTSAPDRWTLAGTSATVARETTDVQDGRASCDVSSSLDNTASLTQSITISGTLNTRLRGRRVTFSARVLIGTSGRVFLRLTDGTTTVDSVFHPGDSTYRTLSTTLLVGNSATTIDISLQISSGSALTPTIDSAILVEGATPVSFSQNPIDPFLTSRNVSSGTTITTTSTTNVDVTGMSIANVIVDGTQNVLIWFNCSTAYNDTVNAAVNVQVNRGTSDVDAGGNFTARHRAFTVSQSTSLPGVIIDVKPAAGNYTYKLVWAVSAGTGTIENRVMGLAVIPAA